MCAENFSDAYRERNPRRPSKYEAAVFESGEVDGYLPTINFSWNRGEVEKSEIGMAEANLLDERNSGYFSAAFRCDRDESTWIQRPPAS